MRNMCQWNRADSRPARLLNNKRRTLLFGRRCLTNGAIVEHQQTNQLDSSGISLLPFTCARLSEKTREQSYCLTKLLLGNP